MALVYSFSITDPSTPSGNSGYAPNGNITAYTDSINGSWNFGYDSLNRLASGKLFLPIKEDQFYCWNYDSFGNRNIQAISSAPFQNLANCQPQSSVPAGLTTIANYDTTGNNRITSVEGSPIAYIYDGAGNIADDGNSKYLYDGDNRLCAVNHYLGGSMTHADGTRVGKGTIQALVATSPRMASC
ncbi:MAG: repeat-associated core domain protein [Candidatus Acidoferrum typicum]|nr:repeat-associated core domain protein [Candidatus Acidoferrum typicum]